MEEGIEICGETRIVLLQGNKGRKMLLLMMMISPIPFLNHTVLLVRVATRSFMFSMISNELTPFGGGKLLNA